jgi:hypothetical protein
VDAAKWVERVRARLIGEIDQAGATACGSTFWGITGKRRVEHVGAKAVVRPARAADCLTART